DRDRIEVRGEDAYESVRLTVREADVYVQSFRVNRAGSRGQAEEFTVAARIPQDLSTRRFALEPDGERIRDIELAYRTPGRQWTKATVCVEALISANRQLPPRAQTLPPGWKELGCHTVDVTGGTGEMKIGRDMGRFSAIQLRARENDVRMDGIQVILPNRERLGFDVRRVDRNNPSRPLSLGDRSHHIVQIDFRYRAAGKDEGQAVLCVDGQAVDDTPRDRDRRSDREYDRDTNWKLIGCQPVQNARETDIYEVGRDEGLYRAIRFHARRNNVQLRDAKIIFNRSDAERILVDDRTDGYIGRDERTRGFDLRGERLSTQKIELTYRTAGDSRGEAVLCIEGLQRDRDEGDRRRDRDRDRDRDRGDRR